MKTTFDFDVRDYRDVRELLVREELSQEDIEEGLEPEEMFLKVCVSDHAHKRMFDTFGRQCEWADVEDLILSKGHKLFSMKHGSEFVIVNKLGTLSIPCKLYIVKGTAYLVLKSVIRNVIVIGGLEIEREVSLNRFTTFV